MTATTRTAPAANSATTSPGTSAATSALASAGTPLTTSLATPVTDSGGTRPVGPEQDLLDLGYRRCRALTRRHATTYYWGTQLLRPDQRRDVYAVYALCRLADDIVDEPARPGGPLPEVSDPAERLAAFSREFAGAVEAGSSPDPVLNAVVHTVRRRGIPMECFQRFFAAMTLDLTRTEWATWEDLRDSYMEGSAAVIGEMMLPVLEPLTPAAKEPARALGLAFQLTNFIRDVGDDLDRGRVYLPQDELRRCGADPWLRQVTPAWREFLAIQIDRNRQLYVEASRGVQMLPPASARCVGTALRMYSAILERIEHADYDVFAARRRVPGPQKAIIAAAALTSSARPRRTDSTRPEGQASTLDGVRTKVAEKVPLRVRRQPGLRESEPTWRDASPARIQRALRAAQGNDPGGWYVVGASRDLTRRASLVRTVNGTEVTLWRTASGQMKAGPGSCPHLGARMDGCATLDDRVVCRWHGLALPSPQDRRWLPYPALDDGVLLWVQLPTAGELPSPEPHLPVRPRLDRSISAVIATPGTCEPQDVIANRLDPWHGGWLHPYAFSHLRVDEHASTPDLLALDVTFRLGRTWGVPVRAEFTCPDARTIVMHIVDGEGAGSVVETHATPLGLDSLGRHRTMVVEATIAHSDRPGFQAARGMTPLVRSLMRRSAEQLWVDDLDYAERRYALRRLATLGARAPAANRRRAAMP
ncbi:MAG TPA: DUF5914 domain-containing protein [Dermatophilaceae bacterium]|nr:DUF5914 domain-containing protein [Dermatophilaceae bacterium]